MSAFPNQQLEGLAVGGQLLGQAAQNQQITGQLEAQRRAAGLEARGQDLQNMMQQRQLAAEAQNYRRLNESRKEMQQAELAQQESQFSRAQAQDRELKLMDQEFGLAIAQAQAKAKRLAAEAVAGQKTDEELKRIRSERAAAQDQARRLEQALNAARNAREMARDIKGVRQEDIQARLTAFHESVMALGTGTEKAMTSALADTILENTRESGGFIDEAGRNNGFWKTLWQNMSDAMYGGTPPKEDVLPRMTNLEKSSVAFASRVVDIAFSKYDDALGLKPAEKTQAAGIMLQMVAQGAVLSGVPDPSGGTVDPRVIPEIRQQLAANFAKLRSAGMQDAQILGVLRSLEGVSERSSQLVTEQGLGATGIEGQKGAILEQMLVGVGNIVDGIESVTNDVELMRSKAGGELVDHAKFDMPRVYRMAQQAYAMDRAGPQMQAFTSEIGRLGIRDPKQVEELVGVLIQNDPELQKLGYDLNPQEITDMILKMEQESSMLGGRAQRMAEEEQMAVQEYGARAAAEGAGFEVDALNELMADVRRRRGG